MFDYHAEICFLYYLIWIIQVRIQIVYSNIRNIGLNQIDKIEVSSIIHSEDFTVSYKKVICKTIPYLLQKEYH